MEAEAWSLRPPPGEGAGEDGAEGIWEVRTEE